MRATHIILGFIIVASIPGCSGDSRTNSRDSGSPGVDGGSTQTDSGSPSPDAGSTGFDAVAYCRQYCLDCPYPDLCDTPDGCDDAQADYDMRRQQAEAQGCLELFDAYTECTEVEEAPIDCSGKPCRVEYEALLRCRGS